MRALIALILAAYFCVGCTFTSRPDMEYVISSKVNFDDVAKWKSGEDCASSFLGIGPFGTRSIVIAAQKGNIKKVNYYESFFHFYLLFWKQCVVVYGK
jgi:hypothetical protein